MCSEYDFKILCMSSLVFIEWWDSWFFSKGSKFWHWLMCFRLCNYRLDVGNNSNINISYTM